MSDISAENACGGGNIGQYNFQGSGSNLCNSTTVSQAIIGNEIVLNGDFWLSDGTNSRYYTRNGSPINTQIGTAQAACVACPTATPTPTPTVTPTPTATPLPTATLAWSYSETGGANGEMRIYVNSSVVETRTNTSSGTYTGLLTGDTIYVEIEILSACSNPDNKGNVYTQSSKGTLVDADCFTSSTGTLTTATYTVVAGDIGTTITLDTFASCDSACL